MGSSPIVGLGGFAVFRYGSVSRAAKGSDCKSDVFALRWFESNRAHWSKLTLSEKAALIGRFFVVDTPAAPCYHLGSTSLHLLGSSLTRKAPPHPWGFSLYGV